MRTPEEQRAYRNWRRAYYKEHYRFRNRVKALRKKGVNNAEEVAINERKKAKELQERKALEKEFPWLLAARVNAEKQAKKEKKRKEEEKRERLKRSEDYVNMLIALEEKKK